MNPVHRFLLLGSFFLLTATTLPAQHFVAVVSSPSTGGFYGNSGNSGWAPGPQEMTSDWSDQAYSDNGSVSLSPPTEPGYGYAHGDDSFVPSEYMDYNKALALGKELLAQQVAPEQTPAKPSQAEPAFADVVRSLGLHANLAPGDSQGLIFRQDTHGNLVLCDDSTSRCRTLN